LAILVGQDDPLDQYYMNHPEYFFGKSHKAALVDQSNEVILAKHLVCASYEKPLTEDDAGYFGRSFHDVVETLVDDGKLVKRKDKWFWTKKGFPAEQVNVRSSSAETYLIVEAETGSLIGTADPSTVYLYLHPGAVYLHQGDSYLVLDLNVVDKVALVELTSADFYTQPRDDTDIEVLKVESKRKLGQTEVTFGQVKVTTTVTGYQKRHILTGELMETVDLDLPPQVFTTDALWFIVSDRIVTQLRLTPHQLAGGIHAAEHASIALLPLYTMCDRWDIGGVSTPLHPHTGQPTIFIYDGYEGGVGISRKGYELCEEHLLSTLTAIKDCPCKEGCPSCIQSPKCGNFNEPLDKQAAIRILKKILMV
jgi:DEAD/DEAH box helicase domain-containing protein